MKDSFRTNDEIIAWLAEEFAYPFEGWDFSYLDGRRVPLGTCPWNYVSTVTVHLVNASCLLDIDTGGGEGLAKLLVGLGFSGRAYAVETYALNVPIARERLEPLGVEVCEDPKNSQKFGDETFDLVISRHGGSLTPKEIFRILKPGGRFITEQIGDRTNVELRDLFDRAPVASHAWPHNATEAERAFFEAGFAVEKLAEHDYPIRFNDVGALVYYLKAVPWEVPGFSVERDAAVLTQLYRASLRQGFAVDTTFHAYMMVAKRPSAEH